MEAVDPRIEETPARKSPIWMRGLFMLVFMFAFGVGQSILYLTAVAPIPLAAVCQRPKQTSGGVREISGSLVCPDRKVPLLCD